MFVDVFQDSSAINLTNVTNVDEYLASAYENKVQFVKLIPSDSNSDIDYLLLGINISNNNISKLIEIGKNKTKTILNVNSIVFDPVIEKDIFIFDENNYTDYYIEKL